jgi:FHA domain-containing protein
MNLGVINLHGFDVPVTPGSMVLGRATDCQLVLYSSRVSRRHAMFTLTDAGLTVQDLGSANGVFVNGTRIDGRMKLDGGDEVLLGDELLIVIPGRPRPDAVFRATLPGIERDTLPNRLASVPAPQIRQAPPKTSMPDATVRADVLSLIGKVADKMLAVGKAAEAERVLGPRLKEVLSHARSNATVPGDVAEAAARHAVKLAQGAKDPAWVEYAFELHACLRQPLPSDVIEQLYTILRTIPPIKLESLRRYVEVLNSVSEGFQPGERFLVKRIRGLEGLASAR